MLPSLFLQSIAIAAILGPISHYAVWVRVELDGCLYRYIPLVALSQPVSLLLLHRLGLSWLQSYLTLMSLQTTYLTTLFISISSYRLFYHPTRIYPGPLWARLWSWWKVKKFIDHNEQGYRVIDQLHAKYGDIVRIGPRQVSINHVDAITAIYGSESKCSRGVGSELGKLQDLQSLRDKTLHKQRRIAWDQALNARACQQYLPRMNRIVSVCVDKLKQRKGQPVVINDWMHFFTYDTMGELGFGQSYGQLEAEKLHPAISATQEYLRYAISAIQVPWLANFPLSIPGLKDPIQGINNYADACLADREKRKPEEVDIMSFMLNDAEKNPDSKLTRPILVNDTTTMQIAAADTSYSALVFVFYYLARDSALQTRIRTEVASVMDTDGIPNWAKLQSAKCLDSVITETLRVHPPVPQGLSRETPRHEGAQIGPYWIPAETMVSAPTWTLHHDERYFTNANEWIPERWSTKPELVKDRRAWIPFSLGLTVCAGKYFAMQEMKIFVARIVSVFDISFPPGEDGRRLINEDKDFFTTWLPDTKMVFTAR